MAQFISHFASLRERGGGGGEIAFLRKNTESQRDVPVSVGLFLRPRRNTLGKPWTVQPGRTAFCPDPMFVTISDNHSTVWGGRLRNRFSESSPGRWAELQLPCCPSKQEELPENMLQNLLLNQPPQTVPSLQKYFSLPQAKKQRLRKTRTVAATVAFSTTPTISRRRSANNAAMAIAASEAPMDMSEFLDVEVRLWRRNK